MGLSRDTLLWASRNELLRRTLPRLAFVRRAVKRFMPGEEVDDALAATEALRTQGIPTLLTHLGENLTHEHEAIAVRDHYLEVLDRVRQRGLDAQVSLKPTQLGLDLGETLCDGLLASILERARDAGTMVWIDMESSEYVDRTLALFKRARGTFTNVGLCLQSYLHRTPSDLHMLMPLGPSIRLVKGAYAEPKHIAHAEKKKVDDSFFDLAMELLMAAKESGARVGIGTHDVPLIRKIDAAALRAGASRSLFEVQMLYGIRSHEQLQLVKEGFKVRVLISYGSFWFPWYMRRLAERPANVWFVMKSILTR
jgi:proline dehydrogenase